MPIQNKKTAPKASSKTDAMKALDQPKRDEGNTGKAAATAVKESAPKPTLAAAPRPLITRQIPNSALASRAKDEPEESSEDDSPETVETKSGGKEKIALDPTIWQWQDDKGAYINIKTGEVRDGEEFLKPAEEGETSASDEEWGGSQIGKDDW